MSKVTFLEGQQIGLRKVIRRFDPPEGKKGTWWLYQKETVAGKDKVGAPY